MTCPLCLPPLPDWWRCIVAPCSSPGMPASRHLSPLRPLATSSSSPTPLCSIPCWREVTVYRSLIRQTVKNSGKVLGLQQFKQCKLLCSLLNLKLLIWSCLADGLFSWSRAVQIRTNLDLVLDWLQGAGLGDIASEFLKKLSVTVNFLCVPKTRLIQVKWAQLSCDLIYSLCCMHEQCGLCTWVYHVIWHICLHALCSDQSPLVCLKGSIVLCHHYVCFHYKGWPPESFGPNSLLCLMCSFLISLHGRACWRNMPCSARLSSIIFWPITSWARPEPHLHPGPHLLVQNSVEVGSPSMTKDTSCNRKLRGSFPTLTFFDLFP